MRSATRPSDPVRRVPAVLDDVLVADVLASALTGGGEWSEVYAERTDATSVRLDDHRVEELTSSRRVGAGVRVVAGTQQGYAYTDVLTPESLHRAAAAAAAALQGERSAAVADLRQVEPQVRQSVAVRPGDVDKARRVAVAREAEAAAWAAGGDVRQVTVGLSDVASQVLVASSRGVRADTERVRTRLVAQVVAARDGLVQTGFEGPGHAQGFEVFDHVDPSQVGDRAARRALRLLDSVPCPAGEMPVVLNAGGAGVLFHEACGHGLEADAMARRTTVYAERGGQQVGSSVFSGVDDPTLAGAWGSYEVDDEGTPAARTVLFEDGVQAGVMSDLVYAEALGQLAPSGHGRRQSYAHVPQPRMGNSLVLPGTSDPAAMVREVEHGLYAEGLGGGEVNPATGDFVFGVTEAYLIEGGELTRRVRGAQLVGNGPRAIADVDAVGTDFAMKQGVCGKGGQWVPVGFGTPTLRIARLTVGGQA